MCWTSVKFEFSVSCLVTFLKGIVYEDVFFRDDRLDSADKGLVGKLQRKAGLLHQAQVGFEALTDTTATDATPHDLAALEQQLQDLETELNQLRADSATPARV